MTDKVIEIQHQIRNNAESIRDYVDDLTKWEDQINALDAQLAKKQTQNTPQPVRAAGPAPVPATETKYKRDVNSIKDYYKGWDTYDVDGELAKLEEEEKAPVHSQRAARALPRSKMVVKGGRSENNQVDRLKDQGNLSFTSHDYSKALEYYKECLELTKDLSLTVVLLSNTAECHLRMREYCKAKERAEAALQIDGTHIKSIVRKAKAHSALAEFTLALQTLRTAQATTKDNPVVEQLLKGITNKKGTRTKELLTRMTQPRALNYELQHITVHEVNSPVCAPAAPQSNIEEIAKNAVNSSVHVLRLPPPKSLVELERTWVMLEGNNMKLEQFAQKLLSEDIGALFQKSSIESEFFMRLITAFSHTLLDPALAQGFLRALGTVKNRALIVKFLTHKEKQLISLLLDRVGRAGCECFGL